MSVLVECNLILIVIFYGYNLHVIFESCLPQLRHLGELEWETIGSMIFSNSLFVLGIVSAWNRVYAAIFFVEIFLIILVLNRLINGVSWAYDDERTTIKIVVLQAIYLFIAYNWQ